MYRIAQKPVVFCGQILSALVLLLRNTAIEASEHGIFVLTLLGSVPVG